MVIQGRERQRSPNQGAGPVVRGGTQTVGDGSSVRNFFSRSLDVGKACRAGGKNRKTWRVWCPGGDR